MMNGRCADDHVRRSRQFGGPVILQPSPNEYPARRERPQPALGQRQKRLRLIDDNNLRCSKSPQQAFGQSARTTAQIDRNKQLVLGKWQPVENLVLNRFIMWMNRGGGLIVSFRGGGSVPAVTRHRSGHVAAEILE